MNTGYQQPDSSSGKIHLEDFLINIALFYAKKLTNYYNLDAR